MMTAYCLFDVRSVTDEAAMEVYRSRVMPVVARFGGRYVAIGGPTLVVEGDRGPVFPVIIAFPDLAAAKRWYDSPDYAELLRMRLGATQSEAVFIEGLPAPLPPPAPPASNGRHDLYRAVHKGLRRGWALLLARLGADGTGSTAAELRAIAALASAHLVHEESQIHTALEQRLPGATVRLDHDHRDHEVRLAEVLETLDAWEGAGPAERPGLAHVLYLRTAGFVAADFAHMEAEETELLPLLHAAFTDEELREIEGRIIAAIPPEQMLDFLRLIIPAVTPAERRDLLAGMRAGMPAGPFASILDDVVRPSLAPADWQALRRDLDASS